MKPENLVLEHLDDRAGGVIVIRDNMFPESGMFFVRSLSFLTVFKAMLSMGLSWDNATTAAEAYEKLDIELLEQEAINKRLVEFNQPVIRVVEVPATHINKCTNPKNVV